MGLLTALRLFIAEGDAARHKRWKSTLNAIVAAANGAGQVTMAIEGGGDVGAVPFLVITCEGKPGTADRGIKKLIAGQPSIHTDPIRRNQNKIVINPLCISTEQAVAIGKALRRAFS